MPVDNFSSYSRFFALPNNIAEYGATPEELNSARQIDPAVTKNPMLAPMASPRVPETRLALAAHGSDRRRLTPPTEPTFNAYEGPRLTLHYSRNAVRKLGGQVVGSLQQLVQSNAVQDPNVKTLMQDSLRRVNGLREFVGHLNQLTESIYAHSIAASKG